MISCLDCPSSGEIGYTMCLVCSKYTGEKNSSNVKFCSQLSGCCQLLTVNQIEKDFDHIKVPKHDKKMLGIHVTVMIITKAFCDKILRINGCKDHQLEQINYKEVRTFNICSEVSKLYCDETYNVYYEAECDNCQITVRGYIWLEDVP